MTACAEVAALRRDLRVERRINDEFVRWKADLRAKAEKLPVRLTDDGVGTSLHLYVKRADVLALLNEADHG